MSNTVAFFGGVLLMTATLFLLNWWILWRTRLQAIESGDLVYLISEGYIRKAIKEDKRLFGVALENGLIQRDGTFKVKVLTNNDEGA